MKQATLALAWLLCSGCTTALLHGLSTAFEEAPSETPWVYRPRRGALPDGEEAALLERFAPVFWIEQGEAEWNRVGTPFIRRRCMAEWVRVDPERATLYAEVIPERVGERECLQLVYRLHFDQLAFTWKDFASLHRNAGLLVLITLEKDSLVPLVLTTVHTCGCWLAVLPTDRLEPLALPGDWPPSRVEIAGESLPAVVSVPEPGSRWILHLATRTHRVRDVLTSGEPQDGLERPLPLRPMDDLYRLEVEGHPLERGSLFYTGGFLRGYVRGAWVPIEGLTAGIVLLDPRLGMDRDFGAPDRTGARFHTALLPWNRERSRLDRFGRLLDWLGFHLRSFGPRS